MPFRIFCNICLADQGETRRKCFITSCGHVACESCSTMKNYCSLCEKTCRVAEINSNLPSEIRAYFEDNSTTKLHSQISKINSFREAQMKLYVEKNQQVEMGYKRNAQIYTSGTTKIRAMKDSIRHENEMMAQMKKAYKENLIQPELLKDFSPDQSISSVGKSSTGFGSGSTTSSARPVGAPPSIVLSSVPSTSTFQGRNPPTLQFKFQSRPYSPVISYTPTNDKQPSQPIVLTSKASAHDPQRHGSYTASQSVQFRSRPYPQVETTPSPSVPKTPTQLMFQGSHSNLLRNHLLKMQQQNMDNYMAQRRQQTKKY